MQEVNVDGKCYRSINAAAKALNIPSITVYERIYYQGLSIQDALTIKQKLCCTFSKDHKGKTYQSFKSMCKAWEAPTSRVAYRLSKGWSLEDALTKPVKGTCKDHLGNVYANYHEMCKAYNIKVSVFADRKRKGWSLEQALTLPLYTHCHKKVSK